MRSKSISIILGLFIISGLVSGCFAASSDKPTANAPKWIDVTVESVSYDDRNFQTSWNNASIVVSVKDETRIVKNGIHKGIEWLCPGDVVRVIGKWKGPAYVEARQILVKQSACSLVKFLVCSVDPFTRSLTGYDIEFNQVTAVVAPDATVMVNEVAGDISGISKFSAVRAWGGGNPFVVIRLEAFTLDNYASTGAGTIIDTYTKSDGSVFCKARLYEDRGDRVVLLVFVPCADITRNGQPATPADIKKGDEFVGIGFPLEKTYKRATAAVVVLDLTGS